MTLNIWSKKLEQMLEKLVLVPVQLGKLDYSIKQIEQKHMGANL